MNARQIKRLENKKRKMDALVEIKTLNEADKQVIKFESFEQRKMTKIGLLETLNTNVNKKDYLRFTSHTLPNLQICKWLSRY